MGDGYDHRQFDRDRDDRQWRDRRDDYRSRQDSSRSPPHRDSYGDHSRQGHSRPRHQDDYRNSRHRGRSRDRHDRFDYENMYDEGRSTHDDHRDRQHHDNRYPETHTESNRSRHHSRSRSRSRSPTWDAGKPTDTVILEGLPLSLTPAELRETLLANTAASEFPSIDVRIPSAKGPRRAFVQFSHVDEATAFVRGHFPKLSIQLQHATDEVPDGTVEAYVHYARAREDAESRAPTVPDWSCMQCGTSNFATRHVCRDCGSYPSGAHWQQSLTGAADEGDAPSHMLVIYPLATFVNEDMLAGDIKRLELDKPERSKDTSDNAPKLKSTAPTGDASGYGARPGSLHRVFLMRDRISNESFKYGFAEFWAPEDAAAALLKFQKSRAFTVAACAVTVASIHLGVFIPEEREVTEANHYMSFHPLFNPSLRVRYRDVHVYPSQQVVTTEPPAGSAQQQDGQSDDKKSKKRKADTSLGANLSKKPLAMAGKMAMWQQKHGELHDSAAKEGKSNSNAPIKISLANSTPLPSRSPVKEASNLPTIVSNATASTTAPTQPDTAVSYVDRDRLMCLICMRKYKSVDEVNIHEKSRNHNTAMDDETLVKAALPRLAARDKRQQKQPAESSTAAATATATADDEDGPQYRDRAKERRQAFNQPHKPTTSSTPSGPTDKDTSKDAKAAPAPSKGAGMLAKMGWTTGAGLGANADGRTDVIATNAYQEGVGLGAEGGNLGDAAELADKKTRNSYADYVNTVQDKARQRYNTMGEK